MSSDPLTVPSIREDLHRDFQNRGVRALDTWQVDLEHQIWGGLECDVVSPRSKEIKCILFYLFGGGYVSGSPEYDLPVTAALAELAQVQVIAPKYPLAPEHPFPAALNTTLAAYRALVKARPGEPVVLCGESAGGGLACAVMNELVTHSQKRPSALVLLSPWVDLTSSDSHVQDPTLDAEMLRLCAQNYVQDHTAADPRVSPIFAPVKDWPATYLSTGSRDHLQPMVRAFHKKLCAAGTPAQLHDCDDGWHVFELYEEFPKSRLGLDAIAAFIRSEVHDD